MEKWYLKCMACGEVFEGNEPQIAHDHESSCDAQDYAGATGEYELVTEEEAF